MILSIKNLNVKLFEQAFLLGIYATDNTEGKRYRNILFLMSSKKGLVKVSVVTQWDVMQP